MCVRILRALFCKMNVISEFAVSAKDCGEIFSLRTWACNFWMVGVIRDTFLAHAFVNASLFSSSLRYRVRGMDDSEEDLRVGVGEVGKSR